MKKKLKNHPVKANRVLGPARQWPVLQYVNFLNAVEASSRLIANSYSVFCFFSFPALRPSLEEIMDDDMEMLARDMAAATREFRAQMKKEMSELALTQ